MIPTSLEALETSELLSAAGKARFAAEPDVPPRSAGDDESVAGFVSRRFGREAYDALVEPLMTGIYGGDGEQLSLRATFPQLRAIELEHGSVLRGLSAPPVSGPPSVRVAARRDGRPRGRAVETTSTRTQLRTRARCRPSRAPRGRLRRRARGRDDLATNGVVLATPAFATAEPRRRARPRSWRRHTRRFRTRRPSS